MKDDGMQLSSLHTGNALKLYSSVGWQSVPRMSATVDVSSLPIASHGGHYDFHDFGEGRLERQDDATIARLADIYEDFAKKFDGTLVRGKQLSYYRDWIGWRHRASKVHVYCASQNGQIVAYAFARRNQDCIVFEEMCFGAQTPDSSAIFLLRQVSEKWDASKFSIAMPLAHLIGLTTSRIDTDDGFMYCAITS
jgi:predicted acetyltransferase